MTDDVVFAGRLLPGERILWSGQPPGGFLLTGRDAFLVPFSAIWCLFVIFWVIAVSRSGQPQMIGFGLLFLAVGLMISVGRFVVDAWFRRGMRYALTDKRLLILRTKPSFSFTALYLDRLPQAQFSARADGRGTVRFGPGQSIFGFGRTGLGVWMPSLDPTPQFIAIPDARGVFDLIQRTAGGG